MVATQQAVPPFGGFFHFLNRLTCRFFYVSFDAVLIYPAPRSPLGATNFEIVA